MTVLEHHTFNVERSEGREDSGRNHVDPWVVDLTGRLGPSRARVSVSAEDPGSDDLAFRWSTGDERTSFNDGVGPDPPHSPWGSFPFRATDAIEVDYVPGTSISVAIEDDDGGSVRVTVPVG